MYGMIFYIIQIIFINLLNNLFLPTLENLPNVNSLVRPIQHLITNKHNQNELDNL